MKTVVSPRPRWGWPRLRQQQQKKNWRWPRPRWTTSWRPDFTYRDYLLLLYYYFIPKLILLSSVLYFYLLFISISINRLVKTIIREYQEFFHPSFLTNPNGELNSIVALDDWSLRLILVVSFLLLFVFLYRWINSLALIALLNLIDFSSLII